MSDVINFRRTTVENPLIGAEELIFYRPEMCLIGEDHETLGSLLWASTTSASPIDILEGIYRHITTEMQDDMKSPDPIVRTKTVCAISKAYELLCRAGYKEFLPLHRQLQIGLYRIAQTGRKVLTRKLLSPTTSDEEADQISQFLVDMAFKRGSCDVGSGNA